MSKRVCLLIIVMIYAFSLFGNVEQTKNIDVSFVIDSSSANYREFGFSSTEVTESSTEATHLEGNSLLLQDNVQDLNLIATGNVYAYWKVSHAGSFTIELSGTPLISNRGDVLHWHSYWTDKGAAEGGNTAKELHTTNTEDTILVYTHSPYSTGILSIDSVPISITTSNGASLIPGRYSGTMTLSIIDGG